MTAYRSDVTTYLVRVNSWLHVLVDKKGFPPFKYVCLLVSPGDLDVVIRFYVLGNGVLTVFLDLRIAGGKTV